MSGNRILEGNIMELKDAWQEFRIDGEWDFFGDSYRLMILFEKVLLLDRAILKRRHHLNTLSHQNDIPIFLSYHNALNLR